MSIVQRHIILGAGLSIIIFIFITAAMITAYPLPDWSQLWDRELMNIPFIVFFLPSVSIVIGIIFGLISGLYWRKQIQIVDSCLHQIEEGRPIEGIEQGSLVELEIITQRIQKSKNILLNKQSFHSGLPRKKLRIKKTEFRKLFHKNETDWPGSCMIRSASSCLRRPCSCLQLMRESLYQMIVKQSN